jgi:PleD family two-component response regulator
MAQPHDTVDSLLRRADELMYESKIAGRNRVTIKKPRGAKRG